MIGGKEIFSGYQPSKLELQSNVLETVSVSIWNNADRDSLRNVEMCPCAYTADWTRTLHDMYRCKVEQNITGEAN